MKLQLAVPPLWPVERLADGRRVYDLPPQPEGPPKTGELLLVLRDSLPLPIDQGAWQVAWQVAWQKSALAAAATALRLHRKGPGDSAPEAVSAQRIQVHSALALTTTGGWPATVIHAALVNEQEKQIAGFVAALYRFLSYGAEAVLYATDRPRFLAVREQMLNLLGTGGPLWPQPQEEPPSLHQMIYAGGSDERSPGPGVK